MSHIISDNRFFAGYFYPTNQPPLYITTGSLLKQFYLMLRTQVSDYVIFSFMVNVFFIYFAYRMIKSWLCCAPSCSPSSCGCQFYPAPTVSCGKPKCAPSCSPIRCILVDPSSF